MHDAAMLHIKDMSVIALQRPPHIEFRCAIRADQEPITPARKHLAAQIWTFDSAAIHVYDEPRPVGCRADPLWGLQVGADFAKELGSQRVHGRLGGGWLADRISDR